jgi:mannose-6-phosphate isomerase-like protein (cupin superfamily)
MNYFNEDIISKAKENDFFRQELKTGQYSQVVVMSLIPGEDIGEEVHDVDQILVFVEGEGKAVLNDEESPVFAGHLVFVPAGAKHNFINTGPSAMKLYTVYAPPEHAPGTVHKTKAEAETAEAAEVK